MSINHLFNKTVSTKRKTTTVDSMFSASDDYIVNLSLLKCRIQKKKGFEPVEGGRKYTKISYVLYCAADTDLLMEDIVVYNGIDYNVIEADTEGNDDTYLRVELEKSE